MLLRMLNNYEINDDTLILASPELLALGDFFVSNFISLLPFCFKEVWVLHINPPNLYPFEIMRCRRALWRKRS